MFSKARAFYPHHPLHDQELQLIQSAQRSDGSCVVRRADGVDVRLPAWMLEPSAANAPIAKVATLEIAALRDVLAFASTLSEIAAGGAGRRR